MLNFLFNNKSQKKSQKRRKGSKNRSKKLEQEGGSAWTTYAKGSRKGPIVQLKKEMKRLGITNKRGQASCNGIIQYMNERRNEMTYNGKTISGSGWLGSVAAVNQLTEYLRGIDSEDMELELVTDLTTHPEVREKLLALPAPPAVLALPSPNSVARTVARSNNSSRALVLATKALASRSNNRSRKNNSNNKSCANVLKEASPPINNRKSMLQWSRKHHPDKVSPGERTDATALFQAIKGCYDEVLA
jgi:hypothetical protein